VPVRRTRTLEGEALRSTGYLFYSQSAATCHRLFQDEKRRASLLAFVAAFYSGRPPTIKEASA
jgi:hypothetical protein